MKTNYNDKKVLLRDELMRFRCLYQQKDTISKKTFWSGSMISSYDYTRLCKDKKAYSTIEGHLAEFNTGIDYKSGLSFPESRYLLGMDGIDHSDVSLRFTIFPEKGRPIDYIFRYDEEDNVFYGVWFFVGSKNNYSEFGGFARLEVEKYEYAQLGREEYGYTNDREKQAIEESIYKLDAYYKHADDISNMIDNHLSNLLPHEEVDDSTFKKAKAYFNKNIKTLEYIFKSDED